MKKIFMVVNEDRFFLSHRKDIAIEAQRQGWNVTIVCKDTGQRQDVEALGLKMLELPINPTGKNISQELKTFFFLCRLYASNKDAIVHHVGLKTILWGSLAAKIIGVKGMVNAVSGLGVLFSGEKSSLVTKGVMALLRFSHQRPATKVIFQNHEDESLFQGMKVIKPADSVFIKGSGVDLDEYPFCPQPSDEVIKIIFTARMVKEKGIVVLLDAAEQLRPRYERRVEFWLCGGLSGNPKAMTEAELTERCDGKYIQWLGFRSDVRELLMQSHIVAFPSYYREGVPKSLIEACAIGRPIVTTNSVGCKDTVEDGKNGFLIPIKDSDSLAAKLAILIEDRQLREQMGKCSREKAEKEFSLKMVVEKHLNVYEQLD